MTLPGGYRSGSKGCDCHNLDSGRFSRWYFALALLAVLVLVCAGGIWLMPSSQRARAAIEGIGLGDTRAEVQRFWKPVSSPQNSTQVFERTGEFVVVTFLVDRVVTIEGGVLWIGGQQIRVGMSQSDVHQVLGTPTNLAPPLTEKAVPGRDLRTENFVRTGVFGFNTWGIMVEYSGHRVRNFTLSGVDS